MERLVNAINQFDNSVPNGTDKMKFASGDIMLGEDEKHVKVADKFLNLGGFMATALGNHECDLPTDKFVPLIKDKSYHLLGMNMNPNKGNPISPYIEKSYIQEINGDKYGIIGLVPPDLHVHVKLQEHLPALNIEQNFDKTVADVQKEVNNLKAKGINKIIVLSIDGLADAASDNDSPFDFLKDNHATPDENAEISEMGRMIREAITKLPAKDRTVVEYRFYRNMQVKDIARQVGLSPSRVTRIVQSALNDIKAYLSKREQYGY